VEPVLRRFGSALALVAAIGCGRAAIPARDASTKQASDPAQAGIAFSWQRWTDSTCRHFRRSLNAAIRSLPDSLRPPNPPDSLQLFPGFRSYYHPEAPLGVGMLRSAARGVEGVVPAWPCGVFLPLYEQPDGPLWGWLIGGWLARRNVSWLSPLNGFPVIHSDQSENALLVYETRGDGWLRVRYYWPTNNTGDGTAWIRTSHLGLGSVRLTFVPWQDYITGRDWPSFVFRDRGNHAVYAQPDTGSRVIDWPRGDYGLRALEVRGDWMRVRLWRPGGACFDPRREVPGDTGWIVWRTAARGSLLWVEAWDC
jgi:hypothetical protein